MNPNHNNFIPDDRNTLGIAAEKSGVQEDRFTKRVQSFEQCRKSEPAAVANFLRVAAADLFRTIPIVERDAADELRQVFENPSEYNNSAFRQYVRTLKVLRGSLEALVALETKPSAITVQSQEVKCDPS